MWRITATIMKRICSFITIICFCAVAAVAQFRAAGVAALNVSNLHFNQEIAPVSGTVGYEAGVLGELMFPGIGFGIDFGLMYNQTGAKVDLGDKLVWSSLGYGNERARMHYIQIPLHLRFKWTRLSGLEDYVAPFAFAGPEFNFLAAHGKCNAFDYRSAEIGLGVGLGVELYRNWQVAASYTWGVSGALSTRLLDDYSAANRRWTISVAYFFKH